MHREQEIRNGFYIPKDTNFIIKNHNIDNFCLKLNHFVYFDINKGYKLQKKYEINQTTWETVDSKIKKYRDTVKLFNPIQIKLKTSYRLLIGSEQSVYETSIKLHHIYGIPYIPSSAIKGVVRSYIVLEKFDSKDEKALEDDNFKKIFGTQEQEGEVIFFDAFPTSKPTIKVDVMTPHYRHYYSEGKAPTDTENPVPINFLTVENTEFEFFIASKEELKNLKIKDKSIIDWFKEALVNYGIGAKTSVGYGYFYENNGNAD